MPDARRLQIPRSLDGARLDEALAELLEGPSRALVQKWVRNGALHRDGNPVRRSNVRVRAGERYELSLPSDETQAAAPPVADAPAWKLVHEDEDLLVVEKPAGMLTHAAPRSKDVSLCELVVRRLGPLPTTFGVERPGVVHRLDRWTSGLVVLGRTEAAMHALKSAFAARRVRKQYLALVHGRPVAAPFECDAPLAPGRSGSDRQRVGPSRDAKPAHTRFAPLERLGEVTLLECRPTTGRRHQIRAHLWSEGLALLGEEIYRLAQKLRWPAGVARPKRQALHAAELRFAHPRTGRELSFESPWPADLRDVLDDLRR